MNEPFRKLRVTTSMKHILLTTLIAISLQSFGSGRIAMEYNIKSDKISDTVSDGFTIIVGKVYDGFPNNESGFGINESVVSTVDHKYRATTGKTGKYTLRIPSDKVSLYFFKPMYSEIVTSQYEFKSQHVVEIDFYGRYEKQNTAVKKPVIYLYPEMEQDISVELLPKGEITFTYPEYKSGWNIVATPEGVIKDESGKEYPYLFWEAEQKELTYLETENGLPGFIVQKQEVISFLEKQLTDIGLNDRESADFITFWGPILQKNEYVMVQFLIDEEYDSKIGSIETNPKMQTVKRVYILCTEIHSIEAAPNVLPQNFVPFERIGSTLVEWGGSEINISRPTN